MKSQTYSGISQDVSQLLNVQGQVAELQADDANATTQLSWMQATYSAMGDVTNLGTTILTTLSAYMSNGALDPTTVQATAQQWLSQLSTTLNTRYDGGYLFGGEASNMAPVDVTAAGYDPTADPTAPDTGYYQGSDKGLTYTGSEGFQTPSSVQANDPGFEEMFRALSLVAAAPTSSTTLNQAYDLIQSGITAVGSSQSLLAASSTALTAYQTSAQGKATTLSNLASGLKNVDLPTAAVLVTNYGDQLQSSYATVTTLLSDNLAKYL